MRQRNVIKRSPDLVGASRISQNETLLGRFIREERMHATFFLSSGGADLEAQLSVTHLVVWNAAREEDQRSEKK
jgi:hypothetical protein